MLHRFDNFSVQKLNNRTYESFTSRNDTKIAIKKMPRFTQVLFGVSTCCVLVLCVHVFFFLLLLSYGSEISLMNLLGSELYLWHSFVLVTFIIVATTKLWKYEQIHESFFLFFLFFFFSPFRFSRRDTNGAPDTVSWIFLFCFVFFALFLFLFCSSLLQKVNIRDNISSVCIMLTELTK